MSKVASAASVYNTCQIQDAAPQAATATPPTAPISIPPRTPPVFSNTQCINTVSREPLFARFISDSHISLAVTVENDDWNTPNQIVSS